MDLEKDDFYRDLKGLYDECKKCMYYHANLTMTDGTSYDGIIENVDPDRIIVLVGEDVMEGENQNKPEAEGKRQYYNYGYGHGYPRMRFRRFRRQAFPLATLAALSLMPYPIFAPPYPYPYPYNNYYPYY